jgi:hypothetical protein
MEVEVGLHHASPPPSYCGYCPAWISWEYGGTFSTIPSAPPSAVGIAGFWLGASDVTAPIRHSLGVAVVVALR